VDFVSPHVLGEAFGKTVSILVLGLGSEAQWSQWVRAKKLWTTASTKVASPGAYQFGSDLAEPKSSSLGLGTMLENAPKQGR